MITSSAEFLFWEKLGSNPARRKPFRTSNTARRGKDSYCAVVLNPLLVDDTTLTVRWGAFFRERIPLDSIDHLQSGKPDIPKHECINRGVMGARPCWIILSTPVTMHTITGRERLIRAINISPDNRSNFEKRLLPGS